MIQKEVKPIKEKKEPVVFKGKYYYGTGRRKTSVARVRLYENKGGRAIIWVNGKDYKEYFPSLEFRRIVEDSFKATAKKESFSISALTTGGGKKGQVEALRHGIARALVAWDEALRPILRENGFLTRDPRVKERKKPGLKKARRAPQWQKR